MVFPSNWKAFLLIFLQRRFFDIYGICQKFTSRCLGDINPRKSIFTRYQNDILFFLGLCLSNCHFSISTKRHIPMKSPGVLSASAYILGSKSRRQTKTLLLWNAACRFYLYIKLSFLLQQNCQFSNINCHLSLEFGIVFKWINNWNNV